MITSDLWHVEKQQDLLQDIGCVTVRWATVDLCLLDIAFIALKNREAAVAVVLNGSGAGRQRIEAFNNVIGCSYFEEVERRSILAVTATLTKLLDQRNSIVHSPLIVAYEVRDRRISSRLTKISKRGRQTDVNRNDIIDHIRSIGEILGKLDEMIAELAEKYLAVE